MDPSTQPIPTYVTSPKGHAGDASKQKKARFTRAEKRQFAKEKKGGKLTHRSKRPQNATGGLQDLSGNEVDAMIVRLLKIREQAGTSQHGSRPSKRLEERVTREVPKKEKKELSAKKLEKIQKRREIRAERKKAWLAKKAAEQGAPEGAAVVPAIRSGSVPAAAEEPPSLEFEEEINFDEL